MGKDNYSYEIMKDLQGFFKPGERKLIYNSCESLRDKVLIRLLWKSGRRISEILKVKIEDINFNNKGIVWHIDKKTKKIKGEKVKYDLRRWKPIDDFTIRLLYLFVHKNNLQRGDYLFKSLFKKDFPITRQRAYQIVRRNCEKAGIYFVGNKKPHPHNFRHTFAIEISKKLKSPADLRKLQILLEHSNLGITEQYLQFNDSELREILIDSEDD